MDLLRAAAIRLRNIPVLSVPVVCVHHYVTSLIWKISNLQKLGNTPTCNFPCRHIKILKTYKENLGHVRKNRGKPQDVVINIPTDDPDDHLVNVLMDVTHRAQPYDHEDQLFNVPMDVNHQPHESERSRHVIVGMPDIEVEATSTQKTSWLPQALKYATSKLEFLYNVWSAVRDMISGFHHQIQGITTRTKDQCSSHSKDLEFYDAVEEL